jgi:type VI secretion system secreted protein VgrG
VYKRQPPVEGWTLGQTSETFESGGKGPGVINDYKASAAGDPGGASYGTYQFASYTPDKMSDGRSRPSSKNSPVLQYLSNSKFKSQFEGLEPGTAAFDAKWKSVASSNKDEFQHDQHEYVKRKYYDTAIANIQRTGLDLSKYGPAVQDLVWSTAVQFGPARTNIYTTALKGKSEMTDKDIVNIVSDYKIANVDEFFKTSSPSIRDGVRSRFKAEKSKLLGMIK